MSEAYREILDIRTGEIKKEPVPAEIRRKTWAYKSWEQMTENDRHLLRAHFQSFKSTEEDQQKLLAYKKYLHHWCAVPCDWLEIDLICG